MPDDYPEVCVECGAKLDGSGVCPGCGVCLGCGSPKAECICEMLERTHQEMTDA